MKLLLVLLALSARAELYSPGRAGIVIRDLAVIGEDGAPGRLLSGEGPSLLLPVFTRCFGTCPVTTQALKAALANTLDAPRVVVLSFDPADTAKDLQEYRAIHKLPSTWRLARGADAAATRAYLDQFGFRVMTAPEGFIHPDATLMLSPKGLWAGTFRGADFSGKDLARARARALAADAPTFASRLGAGGWITAAGVLLVLGIAVLFYRPRHAILQCGVEQPGSSQGS